MLIIELNHDRLPVADIDKNPTVPVDMQKNIFRKISRIIGAEEQLIVI